MQKQALGSLEKERGGGGGAVLQGLFYRGYSGGSSRRLPSEQAALDGVESQRKFREEDCRQTDKQM